MGQRVLLAGIGCQVVFAGHRGVHEFQHHVLTDAVHVPVGPLLERICRSLAAALFLGPFVRASGRMRFDLVGRSPDDVDPAAICLPSGYSRSEMLVRVGDPAVMFLFEFVLRRVGRRIATQPELLDELLAFLVGLQAQERGPFVGRDDVDHVLVQPLLVRSRELFLELVQALLLLILLLLLLLGELLLLSVGWLELLS